MKASVIVPAWGDTPYIEEMRTHLAAQTMSDFEVIEAAPPAGMNDAGSARNVGLDQACGEWVFFVDADDMPERDFLSAAIEAGERTGSDIVAFRADEVDARLGGRIPMPYLKRLVPWSDGMSHSLEELGPARFTTLGLVPWNKAVRRGLLIRHGIRFQSICRSNDVAFTVELLAKAGSFVAIDKALVGYRVNNPDSLQATNTASPTCFYDALLEAKRRLDDTYETAMGMLAKETIDYHLHSVRTLSAYRDLCAFLSVRAPGDFGVEVPAETWKGRNNLNFIVGRAIETLRDRGLAFCMRRLFGKVVR